MQQLLTQTILEVFEPNSCCINKYNGARSLPLPTPPLLQFLNDWDSIIFDIFKGKRYTVFLTRLRKCAACKNFSEENAYAWADRSNFHVPGFFYSYYLCFKWQNCKKLIWSHPSIGINIYFTPCAICSIKQEGFFFSVGRLDYLGLSTLEERQFATNKDNAIYRHLVCTEQSCYLSTSYFNTPKKLRIRKLDLVNFNISPFFLRSATQMAIDMPVAVCTWKYPAQLVTKTKPKKFLGSECHHSMIVCGSSKLDKYSQTFLAS